MKTNTNTNIKSQPFTVSGNWDSQAKALKTKFSKLTDQDLKFEKGHEKDLINRISKRLEKNQEEVVNILKKGEKV